MLVQSQIVISTMGRQTIDITDPIRQEVVKSHCQQGLCHAFILHTSASLMICENADPSVRADAETFLSNLIPDGDPRFMHTEEGTDDMASHLRTLLTETSLMIPITDGHLNLGTWQGIYLWEHRHRPYQRKVVITIMG